MPFLVVFVFISAILFDGILGAPANTYDQQQNGELNVRVDLKDIEIIAMLNSGFGDYGDYDYAYDYSDFTLKPVTSHVTSPAAAPTSSSASTTPTTAETSKTTTTTTTTVKPWHTWPTNAPSPVPQESSSANPSLAVRLTSDPPAPAESAQEDKEPTPATIVETETNLGPEKINEDSAASSTNAEALPSVTESHNRVLRRCNPGLARDQRGRCRLHIRRKIATPSSLLPYGIRLNPQIHRVRDQDKVNE